MYSYHRLGWILWLPCLSASASERFENSYLSFTMPDGWTCQRAQLAFDCSPPDLVNGKRPAAMIVTAKLAGPTDTLAAYKTHLESLPSSQKGITMVAEPVLVNIQGVMWIDATLLGAEVRFYNTRYLGTVTRGLAVLFTFSVHQRYTDKYAGAITLATQTLRVKPEAIERRQ